MFNHSHYEKVPKDYSINLMWINKTLDPSKPYIAGKYNRESEIINDVLAKAVKWKQANPDAKVTIWYDSEYTTPQAIANTRKLLDTNINLRDIREISAVKDNPDVFSDHVPVYFRVDLMKLLLCVHDIETEHQQCSIFSDLEVGDQRKDQGRMKKHELFNDQAMKTLMKYGILFNDDRGHIENQFIQLFNKPETIQAVKLFINVILAHADDCLNREGDERTKKYALCNLGSVPFSCISRQLTYYLGSDLGRGVKINELVLNGKAFDINKDTPKWVKYDPQKHGIDVFCNRLASGQLYLFNGQKTIPEEFCIEYDALRTPAELCRTDMNTRPGNSHYDTFNDLIMRPPTDGSDIYKVYLIDIEPPQSANIISNTRDHG